MAGVGVWVDLDPEHHVHATRNLGLVGWLLCETGLIHFDSEKALIWACRSLRLKIFPFDLGAC